MSSLLRNVIEKNGDKEGWTAEDYRLLKLYGGKPRTPAARNIGSLNTRKYFDSGDYAMTKAGKGDGAGEFVGSGHPSPDTIPHHLPSPVHRADSTDKDSAFSTPHSPASVQQQQHPGSAPGQTPMPAPMGGSPVKEASFLNRETSAEDLDAAETQSVEDRSNKNSAVETQSVENKSNKNPNVESASKKTPVASQTDASATKKENLPIRT